MTFGEIDQDLYAVQLAVGEPTPALDHYQQNEQHPPDFIDIVESRVFVQHRLLSLPTTASDGILCDTNYLRSVPYRFAHLLRSQCLASSCLGQGQTSPC